MQVDASNFERILPALMICLQWARRVAIDFEMTGVRLHGKDESLDTLWDTVALRVKRLILIAKKYDILEFGVTAVSKDGECTTFNFLMRPRNPEALECADPSALEFHRTHRGSELEVSRCKEHGVPYDKMLQVLHLLKHLPVIVHSPVDLFFLLAYFEPEQLLPSLSLDLPKLAALLQQYLPAGVYDVAHLFDTIGGFTKRGLIPFAQEARKRASTGDLRLSKDTQDAYGVEPADRKAHEAGYDSLQTAQLFNYLNSMAPGIVEEGKNRLYLHKSEKFLDISVPSMEGMLPQWTCVCGWTNSPGNDKCGGTGHGGCKKVRPGSPGSSSWSASTRCSSPEDTPRSPPGSSSGRAATPEPNAGPQEAAADVEALQAQLLKGLLTDACGSPGSPGSSSWSASTRCSSPEQATPESNAGPQEAAADVEAFEAGREPSAASIGRMLNILLPDVRSKQGGVSVGR